MNKNLCVLLIAAIIITMMLAACNIKTSIKNDDSQEQQQEPSSPFNNNQIENKDIKLTIRYFAEKSFVDIDIENEKLFVLFNSLFEKMWSITESNDEVIYLQDAPYEVIGEVIVYKDNLSFSYNYFGDSFGYPTGHDLKGAENVLYVVLDDGCNNDNNGCLKGYLVLENCSLHNEIIDFIDLIKTLIND